MARPLIFLLVFAFVIIATPTTIASPDNYYRESLCQSEVVEIVSADTNKLPAGWIYGTSIRELIEAVNQTKGRILLNRPPKDARIAVYNKKDLPIIMQSLVNMGGEIMPTVFATNGGAFGSTTLSTLTANYEEFLNTTVETGIVYDEVSKTIDFININPWCLNSNPEVMASMPLPQDWEPVEITET